MDLKAKKDAREARMQAKREMIRGQEEAIAPTEAEQVSEAKPEEAKAEDQKEDK